ncbi:MAG TPA: VOC family protein [Nitrolancea sp.]|jgi:catechol 2,3-dioxygenase-like lactoylglutathione lyase family enzyme|nr:VOC family protein [Nitrolancea sp.]
MVSGIDHLVILVQKLDDAVRDYEQLGFQVLRGGEHPGGTHNALVGFANGTYLELIAFQEPEKPHDHRWYSYLALGGGLVDFALGATNVEEELERVHQGGLDYRGPLPGARRRPDGQDVSWRMAWPPEDRTGELPFLIDDITPRSLRVPTGDDARHPNGITGVRSLIIAVRDLDEASADFAAITGETPGARVSNDELQADTRAVQAGQQALILAYPTAPGSPLARRIQSMGDGPFKAIFSTDATDVTQISSEQAHGARFEIVRSN